MNGPPRPLTRLVDVLGARPDPERSKGSHVLLVLLGAAMVALNAWPGAGWGSPGDDPYTAPLALAVGLSMACYGASGLLLRVGREGPSLWFSGLQALLLFPMVALGFLLLSGWVGPLWAAGGSALFLGACWLSAARSRRFRHDPADRAGLEDDR